MIKKIIERGNNSNTTEQRITRHDTEQNFSCFMFNLMDILRERKRLYIQTKLHIGLK